MGLVLDNSTVEALMSMLEQRGLVIVPKENAKYNPAWEQTRRAKMQSKYVTIAEIITYDLINKSVTDATIRNWCTSNKNNNFIEGEHWQYFTKGTKKKQIKILMPHLKNLVNKGIL